MMMRVAALIAALLPAAVLLSSVRADGVPDHSGPVTADEMRDAQAWYDGRVLALSAHDRPRPEPTVQCLSQGWGSFQFGRSVNKKTLTLNGKTYPTGFGSHAPAVIEMTLPEGQTRLTGVCGIDDTVEARPARHAVVFWIEADGREVFRSAPLTADVDPAAFDVDVKGVHKLTLKTVAPAGDYTYTPIDYCGLTLTAADGTTQPLGPPLTAERAVGSCFGFAYGDNPSATLLPGWAVKSEALPDRPDRTGRRFTWTDPATGLEVSLDLTRYTRYPVVEWVAHFRNTGTADAPPLTAVRSLDLLVPEPDKALLHYNTGDYESADGYAPHVSALVAGRPLHFAPDDGRPSSMAWPYFNVEEPEQKRGQIVAVAWPGQWAADFSRTDDGGHLHATAGQERLDVRLKPGEEIRTPLSVVMPYRGDVTHAQNLWRRWMLDCNTPLQNGKLPTMFSAGLGLHQSEKTETEGIRAMLDHKVPLQYWWMDAGWYPCKEGQWWTVGTWEPDPERFPHGIKPVSDLAHANHMGLILWIEPERVHVNSWLDTHHPEWLLKCEPKPEERLLDLGNPEAWHWIVDKVDSILTGQGVDWYRQDFNTTPLPFWRAHDVPGREGMTEMRHVEGYLAFWDELHRRHPDLMIDTCASGGRRLDLETLRRAVPLWRSDFTYTPEGDQAITRGLAEWLPMYGSGVGCESSYEVRGRMCPFLSFGAPTDTSEKGWSLYHRELHNWQAVRDDMLGDYYPLLPYRLDRDSWMAWQFDRPEAGRGTVQAFRRPDSAYAAAVFPLRGLEADATYLVTNLDDPEHPQKRVGRDLMEGGLEVKLDARPSAALWTYAKQK